MNFYYENSNGRKIDLNQPPFLGVKSNDLFNYQWSYITQGQAVQKIVKFEKVMKEKKFQVLIDGNSDYQYLGNLERFLQYTETDINNKQMGKLWLDDYYLECYIFASTKTKTYLGTTKTLIELTIICENGNWQSEETYMFHPDYLPSGEEAYTGYGIYYPYDYPYDYAAPFGVNTIINESYLDTDFQIVFYGPHLEENDYPTITIGGYEYTILHHMDDDDYMVINSKKKTCTLVKANGTTLNVFNDRDRNWNIFQKVKSGGNLIYRPESSRVDVTLYYERSEPKYTEAKWT